jgi:hypothetical protein
MEAGRGLSHRPKLILSRGRDAGEGDRDEYERQRETDGSALICLFRTFRAVNWRGMARQEVEDVS